MSDSQDQQTREFLRALPPPPSAGIPVAATNSLHPAVVATIMAFIFAGVLGGLVAAPIALRRLRRDGADGRGVVLGILVVSIVGLVVGVSLLLVSLSLSAQNQ